MGRRTHTWQCPSCGRPCSDTRAYVARQRTRCLACIRADNGWQHTASCTADPAHRGPCEQEKTK